MVKEDLNDPQYGWRLALESKDENGLTAVFHQKSLPGKKLNIVRVDAVYKNCSMKAFDAIGKDWEKYQKEYDTHNTQIDFKILERKEEGNVRETVQYSRSKMGPLASDRDSCLRIITKKDPESGK